MPRSKFGNKRAPVNSENLTAAAEKCISGEISIREAARRYNVSKTTLIRHVKSFKESTATVFEYVANNNTKQVFNDAEEAELKDYLLTAARYHYGLTKTEVRNLAYQFAVAKGKKFPDSWNEGKSAGKEWLRQFLRRHEDLSLRKPEATSLARSTAFNKANVSSFFENYKKLLSRANFTPEKIWNCDETGVTTVHVPPKIIGPRGIKQIGQMTSGERGQNVTIIAAINALGNHIPPMMIFPRVNFKAHMLKGGPIGTIGGANPSGWSNERLFLEFLEHFRTHVKPTVEDPVILILDNHDSHVNIGAIDFCKKNGIWLLTFHPHTSHKMQPLDRTVFGPMKTYYNTACSEWMVMNPAKPISIYDIAELVGKAFPKAFSTSNILKGFEVSGLYPVNENIFGEHEFLTAFVTDRPLNENTATQPEEGRGEQNNVKQPEEECGEREEEREQELQKIEGGATAPNTSVSPVPGCSRAVFQKSPPHAHIFITPEMLRPYPKAPARKSKGGRPRGKSRILTDTPEKEAIAALKQRKNETEKQNIQKVTKRLVSKPKPKKTPRKDSDSEEDILLSSSDGETFEDIIAKDKDFLEMKLDHLFEDKTIKSGDFVLLKVSGKKTASNYVAEIISCNGDNNELKYLRRLPGSDKFINDSSETYDFLEEDIICKLPQPHKVNGTARSNSTLQFDVQFSGYNVK